MENRARRTWLRLGAAALVAAMVLTVAACGSRPPAPAQPAPAAPATAAPAKPAPTPAAQPVPAKQAAPPPATDQPKKGGILRAVIQEPPTIDPTSTTAAITMDININVVETLLTLNEKFEVMPHLAESFTVSPDGKTYTFKLRQGVPFHNGKEMTAEDVVASLNRWSVRQGVGRSILGGAKESIEAPDKYTVVIKLKSTSGTLLLGLAAPASPAAIFPKELVEKYGDKEQLKEIISTGPYKLVEYIPDRHTKLVRFDQYAARSEAPSGYAGARNAYLDEVYFMSSGDPATRFAGLQSNEYQVNSNIPAEQFSQLKASPDLLYNINGPRYFMTFILNMKQGVMAENPGLRRAIRHALDLEEILMGTYGDPLFYKADGSIMPQASWYSTAGLENYHVKPDLPKAKALLAESNYKGEEIVWLTTRENVYHYKPSLIASESLKKDLGLNIKINVRDWATMTVERAKPEAMDVFSGALTFKFDPTQQSFLGPTWGGFWDTPRKKQLLADFNSEPDQAKRKSLWDQIQGVYYEEIPNVIIGHAYNLEGYRKNVKGLGTMPDRYYFNVWLD